MTRTLDLLERKPGVRCCDASARPTLTFDEATSIAADFDMLAHPVRLQLLDVLARNEGRVCVCDLESAVPVKQPTVSHHLRLLREAGLVESERIGVWAHYRVNRERLAGMRQRLVDRLKDLT
ncbi:MAG: winged helix-turn-helix transcriptional regulator [Gemmatimonadaceae bacterium]|nr:winged helix-turn-helix transcriptional regulator [Gemmatimonadaceae bacterium]